LQKESNTDLLNRTINSDPGTPIIRKDKSRVNQEENTITEEYNTEAGKVQERKEEKPSKEKNIKIQSNPNTVLSKEINHSIPGAPIIRKDKSRVNQEENTITEEYNTEAGKVQERKEEKPSKEKNIKIQSNPNTVLSKEINHSIPGAPIIRKDKSRVNQEENTITEEYNTEAGKVQERKEEKPSKEKNIKIQSNPNTVLSKEINHSIPGAPIIRKDKSRVNQEENTITEEYNTEAGKVQERKEEKPSKEKNIKIQSNPNTVLSKEINHSIPEKKANNPTQEALHTNQKPFYKTRLNSTSKK
uniref:Triadin-like n=1 Tax=Diabrotica virgifera virgifera TaxID=50390 RepID=A0A6P7GID4_DIAVI